MAEVRAAEQVLPYRAFGPQAMACKLIGMEWWQWDGQGSDDPRSIPSIKVVVYWNQSLEETKEKFPVDKAKSQDFRYVEYSTAIGHLEKAVLGVEKSGFEIKEPRETFKLLKRARAKAG